tara:strand:- start:1279 stop:1827 length:549 start_codon:yes stop_codon:yes gene_type:complete
MTEVYMETLKRLGIISLMYKDKFGTGLFMPSILQDSRITYFSKLLKMVNYDWDRLNLDRYVPQGVNPDDFIDWVERTSREYLVKETYLQLSYKHFSDNSISIIELPSIGKIEINSGYKTRIYFNLIPDIVMYLLQHTSLDYIFPTKFHLMVTSSKWELIHKYMQEAYEWHTFTGDSYVTSNK